MTEKQLVKIDVVGGFLGAGKTTFLNKLLNDGLKSEQVVIVENEFGDEPIDDSILNGDLEVRTLPSGCICCTLKADFLSSIESIVNQYAPDRILIEPTGLASPAELQNTCELATQLDNLPANVRLNSMTTIVDATDVVEMVAYEMPVYINQITQAHLIVLSHTQELDANQLAEAIQAISTIASHDIAIIDTSWNQIDALEILALSEQAFADHARQPCSSGDSEDQMRGLGRRDGYDRHHDHRHEHGDSRESRCKHHHSYEGFSSMVIVPQEEFDDQALEKLNAALRLGKVMRAKGFLHAPESGMLHYEYVNGRDSATPTTYDGSAKLVMIGRNLSDFELC